MQQHCGWECQRNFRLNVLLLCYNVTVVHFVSNGKYTACKKTMNKHDERNHHSSASSLKTLITPTNTRRILRTLNF